MRILVHIAHPYAKRRAWLERRLGAEYEGC
jgi:hypothetical protein